MDRTSADSRRAVNSWSMAATDVMAAARAAVAALRDALKVEHQRHGHGPPRPCWICGLPTVISTYASMPWKGSQPGSRPNRTTVAGQ